jgi:hypothetical protein
MEDETSFKGYFCKYQFLKKDGSVGNGGCCNLIPKDNKCLFCFDDIIFEDDYKIPDCNAFEISLIAKLYLDKRLKNC